MGYRGRVELVLLPLFLHSPGTLLLRISDNKDTIECIGGNAGMKRSISNVCVLMSIAILCMFCSGSPVRAAGTTYYVAVNGSDNNSGTINQPFATIAHAAGLVGPGDTVNVRGGVYFLTAGIWMGKGGVSGAPVVFQSYPGETAVLDGSHLPAGNDCLTVGASYIDIKNFECRYATRNGINVWGAAHIQILGNSVHDSQGGGIGASYNTMGVVTDLTISGNQVYHNVLNNSSRSANGGWGNGIGTAHASYVTLTNNQSYENYGEGMGFPLSDHVIATGNVVHDNFSVEMYMDNTTNSTFASNLIYTTYNSNYYRFNAPATGIQMANESYSDSNPLNNNQVVNNVVIGGHYGFFYGSYQNGGGMKNTLIANNTFYAGTSGMLFIDADSGHSNTLFANNIFFAKGGTNMLPTTLSGIAFQHNLWWGTGAGVAAGTADIAADPLLINPGSDLATSYRLQANSPARNAGMVLSAVTTDFAGMARPQGSTYDIGAFEYADGTASSTSPSPTASSGSNAATGQQKQNTSHHGILVIQNTTGSALQQGHTDRGTGTISQSKQPAVASGGQSPLIVVMMGMLLLGLCAGGGILYWRRSARRRA